jgi:alpha-beta hydrolase superfamily lysophospholipase
VSIVKDSTPRDIDRTSSHRSRSAARAAAIDADAATFIEKWTDFTAWSSSTACALNNGKVQGNSAGGGSGINHAWVVAPSEQTRAVFQVTTPADLGGSRIIVGFSMDTAGAAATSGGGNALGISFTATTVRQWNGSFSGEPTLGTSSATTWTVTVTADATRITATAVSADGGSEFRTSWARAGFGSFTINNLFVFNSSATGTTNAYIGRVGARLGIATVHPRSGVEGNQRTVHWTTTPDGTNNVRIALPSSYDSRVPSPLVIAAHSHGNTETLYADDSNGRTMGNAFNNAGYIVMSVAAAPIGTEFGNQALLDAVAAGYKYVRDHYNIGSVFSYGVSMGGLQSLLTAVDKRIPGIKAWAGSSAICSLANAYSRTDLGWDAEIITAFGLAAGGSDYSTKTVGHDPLLRPTDYAGLPMLFVASPSDTTVTKSANTDAMIAALNGIATTTLITASGTHNDPSQYPASSIVAFFDQYV